MKEGICAMNTFAVMVLPLVGAISCSSCLFLLPSGNDWWTQLTSWSLALIIFNFVCAIVVLAFIRQYKQGCNWCSPQIIESVLCLFMLALFMPLAVLQVHVQQQPYASGVHVGLLLWANLHICASHIHLPIRVSKLCFVDLLTMGPAIVGLILGSGTKN